MDEDLYIAVTEAGTGEDGIAILERDIRIFYCSITNYREYGS